MRKGAIDRIQTSIEVWLAHTADAIVLAMALLTTADVIGRYVFTHPVVGTLELSNFMLVAVVFLGVGYVQGVKGHIEVDILTGKLSRRKKVVLDIFGQVLGLVIFGIMTWQTAAVALKAWRIHEYIAGVIEFPLWPVKSVIPLGIAVLCLRLILDIWHGFASLRSPDGSAKAGGEEGA